MAAIVLLSSDMLFSSRVLGAAASLGTTCKVAASPAQLSTALADDCRLVLVDLGMQGLDLTAVVMAIRAASTRAQIIAFGPHVDEALLAGAKSAGCDVVLPRSQFHKQYVDLLRAAGQA